MSNMPTPSVPFSASQPEPAHRKLLSSLPVTSEDVTKEICTKVEDVRGGLYDLQGRIGETRDLLSIFAQKNESTVTVNTANEALKSLDNLVGRYHMDLLVVERDFTEILSREISDSQMTSMHQVQTNPTRASTATVVQGMVAGVGEQKLANADPAYDEVKYPNIGSLPSPEQMVERLLWWFSCRRVEDAVDTLQSLRDLLDTVAENEQQELEENMQDLFRRLRQSINRNSEALGLLEKDSVLLDEARERLSGAQRDTCNSLTPKYQWKPVEEAGLFDTIASSVGGILLSGGSGSGIPDKFRKQIRAYTATTHRADSKRYILKGGSIAMRFDGKVKCRPDTFMALIWDCNKYDSWVPFAKTVRVVEREESEISQIFSVRLLIGVLRRQIKLRVQYYDLLTKDGSMLFTFTPLTEEEKTTEFAGKASWREIHVEHLDLQYWPASGSIKASVCLDPQTPGSKSITNLFAEGGVLFLHALQTEAHKYETRLSPNGLIAHTFLTTRLNRIAGSSRSRTMLQRLLKVLAENEQEVVRASTINPAAVEAALEEVHASERRMITTQLSETVSEDSTVEATPIVRKAEELASYLDNRQYLHAATALKEYESMLSSTVVEPSEEDRDKAKEMLVHHERLLKIVPERAEYLNSMLDEMLETGSGWSKGPESKHSSVLYKTMPDGTLTVKVRSELENVDIRTFLAVFYEVDLFHHWLPFCSASSLLKAVDKAELIMGHDMALPLMPKSAVAKAWGGDVLDEHGAIFFATRSVRESEEFPPPENEIVYHNLFITLQPDRDINSDRVVASFLMNLDPMIPGIPQFMINRSIQQLVPRIFAAAQQQAEKIRDEEGYIYNQRIAEKSYFYDWINQRYVDWCDVSKSGGGSVSRVSISSFERISKDSPDLTLNRRYGASQQVALAVAQSHEAAKVAHHALLAAFAFVFQESSPEAEKARLAVFVSSAVTTLLCALVVMII
eukprot:Clim_evm17s216 gene=Clim_evmTU17s216